MILYLETNTLIGAAKGRVSHFDEVLTIPREKLALALPSACIFEALNALDDHRARERSFEAALKMRVRELERDRSGAVAAKVISGLKDAQLAYARYLDDLHSRLLRVVEAVSRRAISVDIVPATLERHAKTPIIKRAADNLILAAVVQHAVDHPEPPATFLTDNTTDFDTPPVHTLLREHGIHYFTRPADFLGWFGAQRRE